jgi:hypothetical protein
MIVIFISTLTECQVLGDEPVKLRQVTTTSVVHRRQPAGWRKSWPIV